MKKLKRIYHRYEKWECYPSGFFKSLEGNKEENTKLVVNFFTDNDGVEFDIECNNIIYDWKYSCEHNLSNESMNRVAWLGQACVAKRLGIDCYTTREAWSELHEEVKNRSNEIALKYLKEWENVCGIEEIH